MMLTKRLVTKLSMISLTRVTFFQTYYWNDTKSKLFKVTSELFMHWCLQLGSSIEKVVKMVSVNMVLAKTVCVTTPITDGMHFP